MPRLARLFISPGHNFFGRHGMDAGEHEAVEMTEIECACGRGIRGDRFFDFKPDYKGQITFFDLAVFRELLATLGLPPMTMPSLVRRNAFTEGLDLNALIGREFEIQGVRFLGVAECSPCHWMDDALAPGAEAFLKGRGGLRCKILSDGVLRAEGNAGHQARNAEPGCEPLILKNEAGCVVPRSSFAGLVLAGGRSTRMGVDKAFLAVDGESLVARQARLLREAGCARVIISGRPGMDYLGSFVVHDTSGIEGPLAGILAGVGALGDAITHLVTLPVDIPAMRVETLRALIASCSSGCGVVASAGGEIEPLVAVLPREVFPALRAGVAAGELSPKQLYASPAVAVRLRSVDPRPGGAGDDFMNWNRREDWSPPVRRPAPPG